MALAPGSRLGAYQIAEQIGAGGMGEVFRAVDTHLNRVVAIKVLPSSIVHDADRLARFEREAHTLAALNHPNIAQVYGFEKGADPALVMEFVEGPTLADRIGGVPMPIDDALPIAVQIADALESAHDHGIIHRDLKPLNVKVRPDGAVKVLDFGLAKAITPADSPSATSANSPTITTPAMTHAGVVLGTASYMSPEQAKGRVVDRRTDIWAFGCVLFEMLTGRRAFSGEDVSDVMVAILRDEPKWDLLPGSTPPHVRSLLRRCLQKDPRKRLPHIGVARLELSEPLAAAPTSSSSRIHPIVIGAAAAIVLAIGVSSTVFWSRSNNVDAPKLQLKIELGTSRPVDLSGAIAMSPDERTIVFVGRTAGDPAATVYLFARRFDALDARQIDGTEGATAPFFSPDGNWVGFFSRGQLKKVPLSGGRIVTICDAPVTRGGAWGDDDVIVFASENGLHRVLASGGRPETIFTVERGAPRPFAPQLLPGGRHILYSEAIGSDLSTGMIVARRLADGRTTELMQGRFARYVGRGFLTFFRDGTLYAVAFDPRSLERRGEPERIVDDVARTVLGNSPVVAMSAGGLVVYSQGGVGGGGVPAPMMWLSQTGALTPLRSTPSLWFFPRFSPDGTRIAMSVADDRGSDVWVYDIARDVMTRVTNEPGSDIAPIWTPDGRGLVFGSTRGSANGAVNLYWQRADGTGDARRLTDSPTAQIPDGFDPGGRRVVLHQGDPATARQSIAILTVEPDGDALKGGALTELVGGPYLKANPRISPDGKWLAYVATGTGAFEVYVQSLSPGGARVQVSNGGAGIPAWSPVRNELYFATDRTMMVVPYSVRNGAFTPEKPRAWTSTPFSAVPPLRTYGPAVDLHPDGARFVVATPESAVTATGAARGSQLVLMHNVFGSRER